MMDRSVTITAREPGSRSVVTVKGDRAPGPVGSAVVFAVGTGDASCASAGRPECCDDLLAKPFANA